MNLFNLALEDLPAALELAGDDERLKRKLKLYVYMDNVNIQYVEFTPQYANELLKSCPTEGIYLGHFKTITATIHDSTSFNSDDLSIDRLYMPGGSGGTFIAGPKNLSGGISFKSSYISNKDFLQEFVEILQHLFPDQIILATNNDILFNNHKVFGCSTFARETKGVWFFTFTFSLTDSQEEIDLFCTKAASHTPGHLPITNDRLAHAIIYHFEHLPETLENFEIK